MNERKNMKAFYNVLGNSLVVSVMNSTVWFAITFYAYLQTKSVLVTGVVAGIYLLLTMLTGIWFGSLVDHHKKKNVLMGSAIVSLALYIVSFIMYQLVPHSAFTDQASVLLWVFISLLMIGVTAGNVFMVAMPTLVTLLVPEKGHAKANGIVGTVNGTAFLVTSFISGILVAMGGMFYVLILAMAALVLAIIHLALMHVPEKQIVHGPEHKKVDIKGTIKVISGVKGLWALILFATLNNFLGGVFMALMDAYGLSMMPVQAWGFTWAFLSTGFIVGGIAVAKFGLGKKPLWTMLMVDIVLWVLGIVFPIQPLIWLLVACMFIYMCLVPVVEAAEQTVLQRVVPYKRQGRVFGFAQSLEQAASPVTALVIGPVTQIVFVPLMTGDGAGAKLIGSWFGTGQARAIALVFILTSIIGLAVTFMAFVSKYYRQLSHSYEASAPAEPLRTDEAMKNGLVG